MMVLLADAMLNETALPIDALREMLSFLPLDDREHLAPLNRTFTRILTPSVNAQRVKLLADGDDIIANYRYHLRSDVMNRFFRQYLDIEKERHSVRESLEALRERYQLRSGEVTARTMTDEDVLESAPLSALRRQVSAIGLELKEMDANLQYADAMLMRTEVMRVYVGICTKENELAALESEISRVEAKVLRRRAELVLVQPPDHNDGDDSSRTYARLYEMIQLCDEIASCYRSLGAIWLRKRENERDELDWIDRLQWLEAKMPKIQRAADLQM